MLAFSVTISARGLSQTVTLSGKEIPLKKIFAEIEKQTGYFVVWNKDQVSQSKPVTVQASKQPAGKFHQTGIERSAPGIFHRESNHLYPAEAKEATCQGSSLCYTAANIVSGFVRDNNGEPLTGATITIKGTTIYTATGQKGYFKLNAEPGQILVFSFIGFESQEAKSACRR